MWLLRNNPMQCWNANAVVCFKPPVLETYSDNVSYLVCVNAEYLPGVWG